MIRKIVLSNFMAHSNTELKLADGLTVLVGPNNIGKSTVAVALKILARNTNSNFVMQHDQKECSISVETSEGHSIQWIKRKSPSYIINGQAKDRLGRGGTPPELDETLRLAAVEFEDKDFEPHFGDQKSPIFLINRPPSQIAQFFSTTSDAEKLVAMQRLHQRHRTEAQTQVKLLLTKNESIQQSIQTLESVPKLESEFAGLEHEAISLHSLASEIVNLEKLIRSYAELTLELQFELHRTTCLERLLPVPAIHPTEHLDAVATEWEITEETSRYYGEATRLLHLLPIAPQLDDDKPLAHLTSDLGNAFSNFEYRHAHLSAHAGLTTPCSFVPTDRLQSCVDRIMELQTESQRFVEIQSAATNLTEAPTIVPEDALCGMIRQCDQAARDQLRLDSLLAILNQLSAVPVIPNTSSLIESIVSLEKTTEQFKNNQSLLDQVEDSIVALESEAEKWLNTEPLCDTCGSKLSADSIRFKKHRHGS